MELIAIERFTLAQVVLERLFSDQPQNLLEHSP